MKRLGKILIAVVLVLVIIFFGLRLINKCDKCDKVFFGTGYEANIISDTISKTDKVLCKSCAEKDHAVELMLGKSISEFRRGLFD